MSTENLKELRNALSCWQDDYDCDDDKEQYDMFGAAIYAVSRLEAAEKLAEFRLKSINSMDALVAGRNNRIAELESWGRAVEESMISASDRAEAAERERDELRTLAEEQSRLAGVNASRAQKAEAELARRDAAAGEPVGFIDQRVIDSEDGNGGMWVKRQSRQENSYSVPIYTAAPTAVLLQSDIDRIVPAIDHVGLDEKKHYIEHALYVDRERIRSELKALGAQQQKVVELPAASVPHGWKLVPLKAFPSQWAAGQKAFDAAGINKIDPVYHAMVEAAPAPGGDDVKQG